MPAPSDVPPKARPVRFPQGYTFWVVGDQRRPLRDAYHTFLRLPWFASIALIFLGLMIANLVFAAIYYNVGGVDGASPGSFFDSLSFSVQTMATIGYGVMNPRTPAAQVVMMIESLVGIIFTALATGLVFAKFARATGRVGFSTNAVITMHDGVPTLIFRCGNLRSNVIVEAQIRCMAGFSTTTAEGQRFYKLHDLKLVRDRMVGLRRGWNVMHVIDETSPFHGKDSARLAKEEVEIEVALTGLDDVTLQTVHTLHTYNDHQIQFGRRFVDTMRALPNGDIVIDLTKFDVTEPDDRPRASVPA